MVSGYVAKIGHYANECYHNKSNDRRNGRPQQGNYASLSNNDNDGHLFVMQHMMSAVTQDAGTKYVWYIDSSASKPYDISSKLAQQK